MWARLLAFLKRIFKPPVVPNPVPPIPSIPIVIQPADPTQTGRPTSLPDSNHYASRDRMLLGLEYNYLWNFGVVSTTKWVLEGARAAKIAKANANQYLEVQQATGVPWFVVAAIHYREASQDFRTCLHNGDRLPGPTTHVPAGRGPFDSWAAAAIDALRYEDMDRVQTWSLGEVFYQLEAYNGFGYRTGKMQGTTPLNASPYIYNGTQFYIKGRSIEDHSWYPDRVDDQLGCMAFLKALEIKF